MAEGLDVDAMIARFRERAHAVKQRPLPPVAGEERSRFIQQAQLDFRDFAMVGDAVASVEDGFLVLELGLDAALLDEPLGEATTGDRQQLERMGGVQQLMPHLVDLGDTARPQKPLHAEAANPIACDLHGA